MLEAKTVEKTVLTYLLYSSQENNIHQRVDSHTGVIFIVTDRDDGDNCYVVMECDDGIHIIVL